MASHSPLTVLRWPGLENIPGPITAVNTLEQALPIKYTVSSDGPYSMLLLPPVDAVDTRPLCRVSWREDFWSPGDIVTSVHDGGSDDGRLVGQFG